MHNKSINQSILAGSKQPASKGSSGSGSSAVTVTACCTNRICVQHSVLQWYHYQINFNFSVILKFKKVFITWLGMRMYGSQSRSLSMILWFCECTWYKVVQSTKFQSRNKVQSASLQGVSNAKIILTSCRIAVLSDAAHCHGPYWIHEFMFDDVSSSSNKTAKTNSLKMNPDDSQHCSH